MRFGNADPEKLELFLSARGPPLSASLGGGGSSRAWASSANRSAFSRAVFSRVARASASYSVIAFRPSRARSSCLKRFSACCRACSEFTMNVSCPATMRQAAHCDFRVPDRGSGNPTPASGGSERLASDQRSYVVLRLCLPRIRFGPKSHSRASPRDASEHHRRRRLVGNMRHSQSHGVKIGCARWGQPLPNGVGRGVSPPARLRQLHGPERTTFERCSP
jgi:hypothetical protein